MTEFLAALSLKIQVIVAGAIGAFISLKFFEGLGVLEKWGTVLGGWGLASFGTGYAVEAMELKSVAAETFYALLIGLFGMSIVAAFIKVIRNTDWSEIVKGLFNRFFGGGKTGDTK